MRVGLIDVDSKIPNLALMKLSAYHLNRGDIVDLVGPLDACKYEKVYASKIFDFTPSPILPRQAELGGTGHDFTKKLPPEIEHIYPDYSLYNCNYAIGYTSRGCDRKCPWCIVPQKEGEFRIVGEIEDFWRDQEQIMLLDNSINTNEEHFLEVCGDILVNKIAVDFNQGLDIRYLTYEQAFILERLKLWKQIHFAWDSMGYERAVRRGVKILGRFNLLRKSMFYVLIGFDTTQEEDLYRVEELRGLGVDPFVMPFNKHNSYQRRFARWVNHKAAFKSISWKDYIHNKRKKNEVV